MPYFAFQHSAGGFECPVIYLDYPSKENVGIANAARIVKGSIKQIPPELEGMGPTQLMAFIKGAVEPKDIPVCVGFDQSVLVPPWLAREKGLV